MCVWSLVDFIINVVCVCVEGGPVEEGGPMGEGEGAGEALEAYGSLWICLICGHVGCGR